MLHDCPQSFRAENSLAELFVTVLVRAEFIFAVVKVNGIEVIQTDNAVKFIKHTVKVVFDIISSVPDVAGVKTDSEL